MYKPWVNAEEYMQAEEYKRSFSQRNEDDIYYREILIQEIVSAMNTLREKYPEVEMKMFVSSCDVQEDMNGYPYIDALDHTFVFNY